LSKYTFVITFYAVDKLVIKDLSIQFQSFSSK